MSSNFKQKAFRQEKKAALPLVEDAPEFKRVQYSLKMALRMVNAHFSGFSVMQYNQPGIIFDKDTDKTSVECWRRVDDSSKENILKT